MATIMTLTPKVQFAVDTAVARGIGRFDAAPPLHRLLWAAGVEVRPPHYASFARNVVLMGGFWGVCMAAASAAWALHLHPDGGAPVVVKAIGIAVLAASVFGFAMATNLRSRARQARLPSWDELPAPGR